MVFLQIIILIFLVFLVAVMFRACAKLIVELRDLLGK